MLGGAAFVFVADPKLIEDVFNADPSIMHHEVLLTPVVGTASLLTLDEPEHSEARRLLHPPFHGELAQSYRDTIARLCEEEMAGWPLNRPVSLLPSLQTITLNAIIRVVFGVDDGPREESLRTPFSNLVEYGANPLRVVWMQQKTLRGRKPPKSFSRLLETIDAVIFAEIERARQDARAEERDDVVAMLVKARHDDASPLTDREMRDHLVTLTFQGHRSTANALAWALERLTRHPEILERAQAEAQTAGEEYLDAVVKETLRIRPPFPFVMRSLKKPFALGEYELPAGTLIALNAWILHHREDLYPEPEQFRPDFLDQQPGRYTWIPFGGGVRACIGAAFALMEIKGILRTILRRFRLAPTERRDEEVRRLGVQFSPRRGARVVLLERLPASEAAISAD